MSITRMYGLSFVGSLDQTARVLTETLGMPFQKRESDWVGDYYISSDEERKEHLRILNDSGQETYFTQDYGDYELFLEVNVESLERAREIEKRLGASRNQLHQAYLQQQREYRERSLQRRKEQREQVRERLKRGEDPYPQPDPLPESIAISPAFLALLKERRLERLAKKQEWLARQEARVKLLQDPHYREGLLAELDRQIANEEAAPIHSIEPRIVRLKRIGV